MALWRSSVRSRSAPPLTSPPVCKEVQAPSQATQVLEVRKTALDDVKLELEELKRVAVEAEVVEGLPFKLKSKLGDDEGHGVILLLRSRRSRRLHRNRRCRRPNFCRPGVST